MTPTPTTTPTSGAADLPEALINIAREIEALKRDCGMDPESSIAIQNGRYMAISSKIRALAAGQATAAQQWVAYAALPTSSYAGRVHEEGFLIGTCPLYTADQMHAFADATHALRASRGQAPAGAGEAAEHYRNAIARARLLDSDLSNLTERGAKAWAGVDAQGLRDGGASPSANAGQATAAQAGEYPALVCDYCGALTPDPWHSSGMLHGKMSKHIHSCDACAARGAARAQDTREPLTPEQIQDLLLCGDPTDEEMRLIRIGWDAANGIKGGQHG